MKEHKTMPVKKIIPLFLSFLVGSGLKAQKIDSICFHLYTDSLKKGTYNYINVDAHLSGGGWKPLTAKELQFSSSHCEFSGNELVIPADFKEEKITVTAKLIANPALSIQKTIWIKKRPDPEQLPTREEIMRDKPRKKK